MPSPTRRDADPTSPGAPPEQWSSPVMVPDPAVLRQAVDRYRALAADGDPTVATAVRNAAYTLCVLTGTRTVEDALSAARALSPESVTSEPSRRRTSTVPTAENGLGPTEMVA